MTHLSQRRGLLALMGALMLDAVIGIALSTLINFDPSKHSAPQNAFLGLHILIAVGIIIGGIVQLTISMRTKKLRLPITIGFLSSLTAFAAGGISADKINNVAVFVMAVCFIIALAAYGYSQTQLSTGLAANSPENK